MNRNEIYQHSYDNLFSTYKKLNLSKKEVAQLLNISTRQLDRRIMKNTGVPPFTKIDGLYSFPIEGISMYQCGLIA